VPATAEGNALHMPCKRKANVWQMFGSYRRFFRSPLSRNRPLQREPIERSGDLQYDKVTDPGFSHPGRVKTLDQ